MADKLCLAKIVKPQGIRGEVKVLTMTDSPEDLSAFDKVYIGGNSYKILKVRPQGGDCAIVALSGIADRNAAELLRDKFMEADKSDAPALPDDTYYIADIVGCAVFCGGEKIGTVADITPARTDIYEVEKLAGGKLLFPAVKGVIEDIDLEKGVVTLNKTKLAEVALDEK
ncbi:MAG: ribosome maturation factor RimM [Clostridia bacterium]|nr:ribosome maturation factor RimM [Clostridia bacterium]